jgi:hypothetical protein
MSPLYRPGSFLPKLAIWLDKLSLGALTIPVQAPPSLEGPLLALCVYFGTTPRPRLTLWLNLCLVYF